MRLYCLILFGLTATFLSAQPPAQPRNKANQRVPSEPREALGTFQVHPEYTVELAAAEPDVIDPVCFCFDAKGDLYVVEMRGYPNDGKGEGQPNCAGRIRKLQDKDGDGYYETSSVFLDGLRFPCGITPWRDGFLVGDAPDLLFVADRQGSGKANIKETLYTGFGNSNIQQMINGLQFHPDGWIYGCNGGNDSPVRSVQKPDAPVVQLRGMHFRLKPDVPGSLEPCSGGGQYGLAATMSGHWLTCTNSQHLRHIVMPYEYLKRNPDLSVASVTLDIPDHGAAARVYRLSPFEAWRVERTTRRANSAEARRFPSTELTPGGFITSACGLAVINAGKFEGQVLVCDPANNLIHRDVLVPAGSTYQALRHDKDCEFLASTDTWFRPVFLANGPDGTMYLADFYREIIETPLSLPDDIKAKWNLNSRERGRIWRIKPRQSIGGLPKTRNLSELSAVALSDGLTSKVAWVRETSQRLLTESAPRGPEVIERWKKLARHEQAATVIAAIHLLSGVSQLDDTLLKEALGMEVDVRLFALKLCESRTSMNDELKHAVLEKAVDDHPHVRFQLALSLGSLPLTVDEKLTTAGKLLSRSDLDSWMETAVLSSMRGLEWKLLQVLISKQGTSNSFIERLARLVSKRVPFEELKSSTVLQKTFQKEWNQNALAMLRGLGRAYTRTLPSLAMTLAERLHDPRLDAITRSQLISLLSYADWKETRGLFRELLSSQSSSQTQMQALAAIKEYSDPEVAVMLLELWSGWSPSVRLEAQEALLSRRTYIDIILAQSEKGAFPWRALDAARREQLTRSPQAEIKKRALALQSKTGSSTRLQVLARYEPALKIPGDAVQGKAHFTKVCASCHQLDRIGHLVGPDLAGALGNKTADVLLLDILDPNREVDPRYVNYVAVTKTGRTLTGLIISETAGSITLKRAEGVEEVILRSELEELQGTGKSLMPENLEEQLSPQQMADLISYLLSVRGRK